MKKSCSLVCPPTWRLRAHFLVMFPAKFVVPSMLWMVQSLSSFLVGSFIRETVLGSMKFSVAPLLIKAFLVSRVVNKRKFIIKALRLLINTCHTLSACAATASTGKFKNLDHQGVPGIGPSCLFRQGEPLALLISWYQFHPQLLFWQHLLLVSGFLPSPRVYYLWVYRVAPLGSPIEDALFVGNQSTFLLHEGTSVQFRRSSLLWHFQCE